MMNTKTWITVTCAFIAGIVACLVSQELFTEPDGIVTEISEASGSSSESYMNRERFRARSPSRSIRNERHSNHILKVTSKDIDSLLIISGLNDQLNNMGLSEDQRDFVMDVRSNAILSLKKLEAVFSKKLTDEHGEYILVDIPEDDRVEWHSSIAEDLRSHFDHNQSNLLARVLMGDIDGRSGSKPTVELRVRESTSRDEEGVLSVRWLNADGELIMENVQHIKPYTDDRWGHLTTKLDKR